MTNTMTDSKLSKTEKFMDFAVRYYREMETPHNEVYASALISDKMTRRKNLSIYRDMDIDIQSYEIERLTALRHRIRFIIFTHIKIS